MPEGVERLPVEPVPELFVAAGLLPATRRAGGAALPHGAYTGAGVWIDEVDRDLRVLERIALVGSSAGGPAIANLLDLDDLDGRGRKPAEACERLRWRMSVSAQRTPSVRACEVVLDGRSSVPDAGEAPPPAREVGVAGPRRVAPAVDRVADRAPT